MERMRSFRSDNNAGLCPEALDALVAANDGGHALGYGDDAWTSAAEAAFQWLLGADTRAFLVGTGTAANTLAVAALTEPWQRQLGQLDALLAALETRSDASPARSRGLRDFFSRS